MDENGEFAVKPGGKLQKKQIRGKPFEKGYDPRRNTEPGPGRPPNEASITYWMRTFAAMSPPELAEKCTTYADQLRLHQEKMPIAAIIATRALLALMDDPQASMLNVVMERTESDGAALPVTVIIGSSKWTPR